MSIENIKSNIVHVNSIGGDTRILNLEQVIYAIIDVPDNTTSTVCVNEGVTPVELVIEGNFKNIIAGAGGAGMNSGPLFGEFTNDDSPHVPIVLNFDQITRFASGSDIRFSHYGSIGTFSYVVRESPADVLGASGHSIQDVGIFRMNGTGGTIRAPVQTAAGTAGSGGLIVDDTYYLKVTALTATGETTGSNEVSVTTTAGEETLSTITANWGLVTYATGYRVYIGTSAGAESSYFEVGAGVSTLLITALPGTTGTVPVTNTATTPFLNTHEFVNIKSITHQIPLNPYWDTYFIDGDNFTYIENIKDLVGG